MYLNGACVGQWNGYKNAHEYELTNRLLRVGDLNNANCDLDELKFFNRSLSAVEVKVDFESNFSCVKS
jgi:hypothetical protein